MRKYKVRRAANVTRDLELIADHLIKTYQQFGEDRPSAFARATARIEGALVYMRSFITHPHRGSEQAPIRAGVRTVTSENFIIYFEVDDVAFEVRILAVFFGGADHRSQMKDRLRT